MPPAAGHQLRLLWLGLTRLVFLQVAIGFVDGFQKLAETGRLVDRPEARKAVTQQLNLTLGEQPDRDNSILRQAALRF